MGIISTMFSTNKTKKSDKPKHPPKTAQETLPYERIFKNGMIESSAGYYTMMYPIEDINFKTASEEQQDKIFLKYEEFLNSFGNDVSFSIVVNIKNVGNNSVEDAVLLKPRPDSLAALRDEYNSILKEKITQGRNNLICEKYLVVGTHAKDAEEAKRLFNNITLSISSNLYHITKKETEPFSINDRVRILYEICNIGKESLFNEDFSVSQMIKQGMSSKDIIAPSKFVFENDYMMIGDMYAKVMYLKMLPSSLSTNFMADLSNLNFNMLTNVFYSTISTDKAIKIIKNKLLSIKSNILEKEQKAAREGYNASLVASGLNEAAECAQEILDDITQRNQKTFFMTMAIMVFGESKEELKSNVEQLITLGNRYILNIDSLYLHQELGFKTVLPLGRNELTVKRLLKTEEAAIFIPFTSQELLQKDGIYYGLNPETKNIISYNRFSANNQNGIILGEPGSGKSLSAKREMLAVLLGTNDDVFVIDPEGEYAPLVDALGSDIAEEIKLMPGNKVFINPFDMDLNYAKNDDGSGADPLPLKTDFIFTLCETIMGQRYVLTANQKSIIDRCVRRIYQGYLRHMQTLPSDITCDVNASPTLDMFYEELMAQPESEARNIALATEVFLSSGSLNSFSQRTNVNQSKRFVVYNIKELGAGMKELGLKICLNHIWNKIISNKGIKRTWFYIDEFYILLQSESSATFLMSLWKRARKWGGVPTGITQNVEDLLNSEAARAVIKNSAFVYMLSQTAIDRASLAQLYNLSDTELNYIATGKPGIGLLYNGSSIIPFEDKFPKNTTLFNIMQTSSAKNINA